MIKNSKGGKQMRNFFYYNDTGRSVKIHPGTDVKVKFENDGPIEHGKTLKFSYPKKFSPLIKMWDYGEKHGLQIIVMLVDEENH